jgi:hypothetical protein
VTVVTGIVFEDVVVIISVASALFSVVEVAVNVEVFVVVVVFVLFHIALVVFLFKEVVVQRLA